jgi:hypothetical protein
VNHGSHGGAVPQAVDVITVGAPLHRGDLRASGNPVDMLMPGIYAAIDDRDSNPSARSLGNRRVRKIDLRF